MLTIGVRSYKEGTQNKVRNIKASYISSVYLHFGIQFWNNWSPEQNQLSLLILCYIREVPRFLK